MVLWCVLCHCSQDFEAVLVNSMFGSPEYLLLQFCLPYNNNSNAPRMNVVACDHVIGLYTHTKCVPMSGERFFNRVIRSKYLTYVAFALRWVANSFPSSPLFLGSGWGLLLLELACKMAVDADYYCLPISASIRVPEGTYASRIRFCHWTRRMLPLKKECWSISLSVLRAWRAIDFKGPPRGPICLCDDK